MGIFETIGSQIGSAIDNAVGAVAGAVGAVTGAAAEAGSEVLKAIPAQVEGALNVLRRSQNIVQEQITAPLRAMVGQVTGGIWTGPGADAFVEEVTNLMAPASVDVFSRIGNALGAIQGSLQAIQEADQKATAVVSDLAETFASIY